MAQNSSEQLIKIFSQSSNPNAIEYVKSLKKSSKQIDYSPRQSSLEQSYLCLPFDRRGQLWVTSSEELSFLSSEDKQKIIINMAYVHLDRELKKGKKITEIAHHPIIEVNNYLFNHR